MSTTILEDSKLDFTFDLTKNNFSKLGPGEIFWSPTYSVADVTWKLKIKRTVDEVSKKPCLSTHLYVEGKPKLWCCYARVCAKIISQEEHVEDYSGEFEHLFSAVVSNQGWSNFMKWDELIDPKSGFIKDDTVKFQVHILADPPQNVDPDDIKAPESPTNADDGLSVLEDRLNTKIVRRLAEEFKKISSLSKNGFECMKISGDTLEKDISNVQEDVYAVKEDMDTVKEDINSVNEKVDVVLSAVDELKNCLLKTSEIADKEKCNEVSTEENCRNKRDRIRDQPRTTEAVEDFVVKMLNDFKNDMMKEFFATSRCRSIGPPNSCDVGPWYERRQHFYTHPHYEPKMESDCQCHSYAKFGFPSREIAHCDLSERSAPKKRKKVGQGYVMSSPSGLLTQRQFQRIERVLVQKDGCDSDSSDSSCRVIEDKKTMNIPTEDEALRKNMDLNKPWKKELLLVGKDDEGKLQAHKVKCLKEFYDLQKKYKECDVIESEIVNSV